MNPLQVWFHPVARRELRRAVAYYDEQVPELGDDLITEVEQLAAELTEYPELGAPYEAGTRRALVRRFPYSLIYRARSERVEIIAVAHHRRRPAYWRKRV